MARRIAPRLAGGMIRLNFGSRLAPDVKKGLKAIARLENKSMSWVVEEVIIEFFQLRRPKYDPRYKPQEEKVIHFSQRTWQRKRRLA